VGLSRVEISELVHAYCDAVTRRDAAQWASCWASDATWVLPRGRRAEGREAIVALWRSAINEYGLVVQHAHDGTAVLAGDRGTGRWHISEHARRRDGRPVLLLAAYDDEYVRVDGAWKFAARSLDVQYHGPPDLAAY